LLRGFAGTDDITAISAAGLLSQTISPQTLSNPVLKSSNIKPNRLKEGDKIGLIAPGFQITEDQLEKSIQNLKIFGQSRKIRKYS